MFTDVHTEPYHTTSHTHLTPKLQRGHTPRFVPILPPPAPSLFSQGECGHCTPDVHSKFCSQDSNPADPSDWGLRPGPRETQQGAGLPLSSEFAPGAQPGGGARKQAMLLRGATRPLLALLSSPPPSLLEFLSFSFSISPSHRHLPSSPWPRTKLSFSLPGSAALEAVGALVINRWAMKHTNTSLETKKRKEKQKPEVIVLS